MASSGALVASSIPGRIRLRFPGSRGEEQANAHLAKNVLEEICGVREVQISPATGSALVIYDPVIVSETEIVAKGRESGVIAREITAESFEDAANQRSVAAREITRRMHKFDCTVRRLTRGLIDGRTLVPLALFTLSMTRYLFAEQRSPAPWQSLLWYSYSMFMHWNSPKDQPAIE